MGKLWGSLLTVALATTASSASAQPLSPPAVFTPNRQGTNRWEGSLGGVVVSSLLHGSGPLTYNTQVSLDAALLPRVWLGRGFQLRASLSLTHAFSNSDVATTGSTTLVNDATLATWFHGIPSFGDFHPAVALGLVLPLSSASRARTMLLATQVMGQLAWWRRVGEVTLFARASLGWEHPFFQYIYPARRSEMGPDYTATCYGIPSDSACSTSPTANSYATDGLWWSLTFAPRWRWLSPGISFAMSHTFFSTRPDGVTPTAATNSDLSAWLELIPTPSVSVQLAYTASYLLEDNGGLALRGHVLGVALALRLDELVAAARGEPAGPGGIVRW